MESILKNKKIFYSLLIFLLIALFAAVYFAFFQKEEVKHFVSLSGQKIEVEIADSELEQYRGLSGRLSLKEGQGMLFVFSDYQNRRFVMRNMKFPLDIIFIKDSVVTEVRKNCPPEGSDPQKIYESGAKVNYVLEVPAGYANKYGIEAGASFSLIE